LTPSIASTAVDGDAWFTRRSARSAGARLGRSPGLHAGGRDLRCSVPPRALSSPPDRHHHVEDADHQHLNPAKTRIAVRFRRRPGPPLGHRIFGRVVVATGAGISPSELQ